MGVEEGKLEEELAKSIAGPVKLIIIPAGKKTIQRQFAEALGK